MFRSNKFYLCHKTKQHKINSLYIVSDQDWTKVQLLIYVITASDRYYR